MTDILEYSIIGLQEFKISFEKYCKPCEIQHKCKFGKDNPFIIEIDCKELNQAKETIKYEQLKTLQKTEPISTSYEDLIKKVKINIQSIFSQIWKEKIKALKEEIRCLDSRKTDPMLVGQQGQDWWSDFNSTMKLINKECEKIL